MIKTVIFDMDGVIIDTEPIHHYAFITHFAELGLAISDEEYASFLGKSTQNVYQSLKEKYELSQDVEALMRRKRELFNQRFDEDPTLDLLCPRPHRRPEPAPRAISAGFIGFQGYYRAGFPAIWVSAVLRPHRERRGFYAVQTRPVHLSTRR
jgi:FMN phosphatase YigB (HAD superfamily)